MSKKVLGKMSRKQWLVVGICGVTCSGKTTLANRLKQTFPDSVSLHQDLYFLPEDDPRHVYIPELKHNNWDSLSSVDMERLYNDAKKMLEEKSTKRRLLIIDGFLVFNYKPLADLCDLRYFLNLTREVCWERRQTRHYDPPDVPGYFDRIVWPEYEKHKAELGNDKDLEKSVKFLDGAKSMDDVFQQVLPDIEAKLRD